MKFSVIIPAQKLTESSGTFLKEFSKQTFKDFEIIFLSDIDEKEKFQNTLMVNTGKVPPSEKRNIGVKKAKGEIIAFIDDDAYPSPDWLEIALKDFENKEISAIGGPSIVPPEASFFQKVSNKVYELSSSKTGIRYGRYKRQEIDDWPTCNFFVRKKDFEKTKGFDSAYWGGEDTQLCYSLINEGKKIIYNPNLIIYHHPRKKLKNHLRQSFFWGMWRGFFIKKYKKQSWDIRFLTPAIFVLWLIFGSIFSLFNNWIKNIFLISLIFYAVYLLYTGIKSKDIKLFFPVMLVLFLTHVVYGAGIIKGLLCSKKGPTRGGMHPFENLLKKK